MKYHRLSEAGIALSIVIVSILLLSILAASALTFGFHQRKLAQQASGDRTEKFYRAKAASIDADERMRTNFGLSFFSDGCSSPVSISNPNCKPLPYYLDVDGDDKLDVRINISKPDPITGLRTVESKTISPTNVCNFCATADCQNFCDSVSCCCTDLQGNCL